MNNKTKHIEKLRHEMRMALSHGVDVQAVALEENIRFKNRMISLGKIPTGSKRHAHQRV